MKDIIQATRAVYNRIAQHFSGTRYDLWPEIKQFAPLVKNGQTILDWGCGNGRLILLLKSKKVNYFGLDQSEELIKIARGKYAQEIKDGWVKFIVSAGGAGSFEENFFDLVFMIASFHHLPDKDSRLDLLKAVYRQMKIGAKLTMTNWNLTTDWAKQKMLEPGWRQVGKGDFIVPWKNSKGQIEAERYYHAFTAVELSELLQEAGFVVEKMDFGGIIRSNFKRGRNLVAVAVKSLKI